MNHAQHLNEWDADSQLSVSRAGHPRPKLIAEGRRKIIYYVSAFLNRLAMWEHPNAPTRILFDKDDAPRHEEPLLFPSTGTREAVILWSSGWLAATAMGVRGNRFPMRLFSMPWVKWSRKPD